MIIQYGSLFEEFRYRESIYACLFYVLYIARRFTIGLVIVFAQEYPELQLAIIITLSVIQIAYLLKINPYKSNLDSWLNLANELTILMIFILDLCFIAYDKQHRVLINEEMYKETGKCILLITTLLTFINISVVLFIAFKLFYLKYKNYKNKSQLKLKTFPQKVKTDLEQNMKQLEKLDENQLQKSQNLTTERNLNATQQGFNLQNIEEEKQQDKQSIIIEDLLQQQQPVYNQQIVDGQINEIKPQKIKKYILQKLLKKARNQKVNLLILEKAIKQKHLRKFKKGIQMSPEQKFKEFIHMHLQKLNKQQQDKKKIQLLEKYFDELCSRQGF